jgi:hypothetical protein
MILIGDYCSAGVLSYDQNRIDCEHINAAKLFRIDDFCAELALLLTSKRWRVTVDISSFDRSMIAEILTTLFRNKANVSCVELIYYPQEFVEPEYKLETVKSFGPVSPYLAGSPISRSNRLCLIFGAGHEVGKAVGALDTIEPDEVFCFRPHGIDQRYDLSIMKANLDFDFIQNREDIIDYQLEDPFDTLMKLRSIIDIKSRSSSVMVLPLGPKMFAAICIILALIYHPKIKVWRHSTISRSDLGAAKQAKPTGSTISFKFSFLSTGPLPPIDTT